MVKQLITTTTFLLIQDVLEIIYNTYVILNFIILAQYSLQNDKILSYIKHALYKPNKIKITFENYCSIILK